MFAVLKTGGKQYRVSPGDELLVVADRVAGLQAGIYRYRVRQHALERVAAGTVHGDLAKAALGQAIHIVNR